MAAATASLMVPPLQSRERPACNGPLVTLEDPALQLSARMSPVTARWAGCRKEEQREVAVARVHGVILETQRGDVKARRRRGGRISIHGDHVRIETGRDRADPVAQSERRGVEGRGRDEGLHRRVSCQRKAAYEILRIAAV